MFLASINPPITRSNEDRLALADSLRKHPIEYARVEGDDTAAELKANTDHGAGIVLDSAGNRINQRSREAITDIDIDRCSGGCGVGPFDIEQCFVLVLIDA